MHINEIVSNLINEEHASIEQIKCLIDSDIAKILEAADAVGESPDYVIEMFLEYALNNVADFHAAKARIETYWLYLDDVPGGSHFEVNVRAAELLSQIHKIEGIKFNELSEMASHIDWQVRMVAAWIVRDTDEEDILQIKEQLANDTFEDDNGLFLVREGTGLYDN